MKVLTINTSPAFFDGITNVITNINHAIDKKNLKNDLLVVAEPSESFITEMKMEGTRVFYLRRSMKDLSNYMISLTKILTENHYDIVHIHGNSHTTVIELLCSFFAGCRVRIVHAHNTYCLEKTIHVLATPFFDLLCTNRMACGEAAGRFMHGKHRFTIINNGIDTIRFAFNDENREELRKKYKIADKVVIGHVGTLYDKHKNQSFVFDILKELNKYCENFCLVCVGEGPDKAIFMQKVNKLGLSKSVTFIGAVEDTAPYLSLFDLIVMPSNYEGLPLSLIEEQANGLHCYVSDNITKEVDKTNLVHFISLNEGPSKWADIIKDQHNWSENRKTNSNNAIENIKNANYDISIEAEKVLNCYQSFVD